MLASTFKVGELVCHTIDAGRQSLDGGAMFGVVPKVLWEKSISADERNRIPLGLTCLLVEHSVGLVLIDTGIGNKESEKFRDIYSVENDGTMGPTRLEDGIIQAGFRPENVSYVINTHLHFDHAGGNTVQLSDQPSPRPSFPLAKYVVQEGELDFALHTNERTAASYLAANIEPISQAHLWEIVSGETELLPGIRVIPTPGHVPHHQSVLISDRGESACFLGDMVPTSAHLRLPWMMGYDLEPLVNLGTKRRLLEQAEAEGWILIFEHDPIKSVGRVVREGKSYVYAPLDTK